jgi:phospholipid/cholesterol/gamma-HCH transport system ATP-binding protein
MSTDAATPIISIRDLKLSFNGQQVLRGLDLDIPAGQTLTVIGGSGCGKTVLLKCLIGLLTPDSGTVTFKGSDLTTLHPKELVAVRTRFGMVFQGSALFDSMTVGENVAFPLEEHSDIRGERLREIVSSKLSQVGLVGIEAKFPAELSGGMRKRVALARALAMDPEVILYDEPTTGLDPVTAASINHLIVNTHKATKATSVVVTHDMVSAYTISERIVMLHEGRIIADETPAGIRTIRNLVVRQFIEGVVQELPKPSESASSPSAPDGSGQTQ